VPVRGKIPWLGFRVNLRSFAVKIPRLRQRKRRFVIPEYPMNKAELIDEVQRRLGAETSKAAAERAVDAVLAAVGTGIRRDREVQLVGFGTFDIARRAARRGYNPHTRQPMKIRAMKTIRFKAGLALKAAV